LILTRKQEEGLKICLQRLKDGEPYTCIAGYAGTGKSTLVSFIVAALGLDPDEDVCYVAYTGKAAKVLQQKGCSNAKTAHKLLYDAIPLPDGKYIFQKKDYLDDPYCLIIVDEVSMLPKTLWEDLLSHHIPIIALGDPEQLPPVSKDEDNGILLHPHIFLDEIMRQAAESEIIRLSLHVRNNRSLSSFDNTKEQVQLINSKQIVTGMYDWADQILCATNATRNSLNQEIRKMRGMGEEPCVGDKIISLKNHWHDFSIKGFPLTNGNIGYIQTQNSGQLFIPYYISKDKNKIETLNISMIDEDGDIFDRIAIDYNQLKTGEPSLTDIEKYKLKKNKKLSPFVPFDFAYAYAITVWKAQGSEWDKVMLYEEKFPFDAETHRKYLYTGLTRAADKLVLVENS
jgi:exodeoxyribonuclease-5